jgi:hypothetical protein
MIKQLQGVFSAYPHLKVTGWRVFVVKSEHIKVCEFLMNDDGVYDVWFSMSNKHPCLSQGMVKVVHDALVLLNAGGDL